LDILRHCHEGVCGGHFATEIITRKILQAGYFWPFMFADSACFCKTCQQCQAYGRRSIPYTKFNPIFPTGIFEKWGADFVGPLPMTAKRNEYLIVATDYLSKWSEAMPVKHCNKKVAVEFIFAQIICCYGCPLEIVTDQGTHFINEVVTELMKKMSIKH